MRRILIVFLLLPWVLSCGPARRSEDNDCRQAKQCGAACCTATEKCADASCVACTPTTCAAAGAGCGSVDDGCGGTLLCGDCQAPLTCGGAGHPNLCEAGVCVPATCAGLDKNCGQLLDGCGHLLDCGVCADDERCGGGGANRCGTGVCAPESDRAFCSRLGRNCSPHTAFDNCDDSRVVASCGECGSQERCEAGRCVCVPEDDATFCRNAGKDCGLATARDSCGATRTANCGFCSGDERCGGAGVANVCAIPLKKPIGGPCAGDSDCAGPSPRCLLDKPGGLCVQTGCTPEGSDCPAGSGCFALSRDENICVKTCSRTSDCGRPGEPFLCDTDHTCWSYAYTPINAGGAGIGAACSADAACEGDGCYESLNDSGQPTGFDGGYCTSQCSDEHPEGCPAGSSCLAFLCQQTCSRASDCRSGYQCLDGLCLPDPARTRLGAACTPTTVGTACGAGYCLTHGGLPELFPGGYCTTEFACTGDAQCGANGVCRPPPALDGSPSFCEKACQSAGDCRAGYTCSNGSCRVPPTTNAALVKLGAACANDAACVLPGGNGGLCLRKLMGSTANGGYCAAVGCPAAGCGPNGSCVQYAGASICLRSCGYDADCRASEGYACDQAQLCMPR